jgi:TatD DNase family protein
VIDELKEAGIDKLSVSLNAHNKETYDSVCKPKLENAFNSVLEFISKASADINTEITAVTIPEVKMSEMEALAKNLQVKLRIRQCEQFFW